MIHNLCDVNDDDFVVIDMTTGTVLGTNLVLVPMPDLAEEQEDLLSNDSTAIAWARDRGIPLYVEMDS